MEEYGLFIRDQTASHPRRILQQIDSNNASQQASSKPIQDDSTANVSSIKIDSTDEKVPHADNTDPPLMSEMDAGDDSRLSEMKDSENDTRSDADANEHKRTK